MNHLHTFSSGNGMSRFRFFILLWLLCGCGANPARLADDPTAAMAQFIVRTDVVLHLGTDACGGFDPVFSARVASLNPQYVRAGAFTDWATIATARDPNTWNWTRSDQTVNYEYGHGRRIIHCAFVRPEWQTDDSRFMEDFTTFLRLFYTRYRGKIYAAQIWNEPTYCNPITAHWGSLPGVTNDQESLWNFLPSLYKAARNAVKSVDPNVLIIGPDWQGPWWQDNAEIWKRGAGNYLDVCSFHEYNGYHKHPDGSFTNQHNGLITPPIDVCVQNIRAAMGNQVKPIWCTEMALFGDSPTTMGGSLPCTGGYCSGYTKAQGVTDAVNYVILMRKAGVEVIIPHDLAMATSATNANIEICGYKFDDTGGDGSAVPMKSKTIEFIRTLSRLR